MSAIELIIGNLEKLIVISKLNSGLENPKSKLYKKASSVIKLSECHYAECSHFYRHDTCHMLGVVMLTTF